MKKIGFVFFIFGISQVVNSQTVSSNRVQEELLRESRSPFHRLEERFRELEGEHLQTKETNRLLNMAPIKQGTRMYLPIALGACTQRRASEGNAAAKKQRQKEKLNAQLDEGSFISISKLMKKVRDLRTILSRSSQVPLAQNAGALPRHGQDLLFDNGRSFFDLDHPLEVILVMIPDENASRSDHHKPPSVLRPGYLIVDGTHGYIVSIDAGAITVPVIVVEDLRHIRYDELIGDGGRGYKDSFYLYKQGGIPTKDSFPKVYELIDDPLRQLVSELMIKVEVTNLFGIAHYTMKAPNGINMLLKLKIFGRPELSTKRYAEFFIADAIYFALNQAQTSTDAEIRTRGQKWQKTLFQEITLEHLPQMASVVSEILTVLIKDPRFKDYRFSELLEKIGVHFFPFNQLEPQEPLEGQDLFRRSKSREMSGDQGHSYREEDRNIKFTEENLVWFKDHLSDLRERLREHILANREDHPKETKIVQLYLHTLELEPSRENWDLIAFVLSRLIMSGFLRVETNAEGYVDHSNSYGGGHDLTLHDVIVDHALIIRDYVHDLLAQKGIALFSYEQQKLSPTSTSSVLDQKPSIMSDKSTSQQTSGRSCKQLLGIQ